MSSLKPCQLIVSNGSGSETFIRMLPTQPMRILIKAMCDKWGISLSKCFFVLEKTGKIIDGDDTPNSLSIFQNDIIRVIKNPTN